MIVKQRTKPIKLLQVEMLRRRSTKNISLIESEYKKRMNGYKGEVNVDYFLKFLPKDTFYIFHGIEIMVEGMKAQIDNLIISKKIVTIFEVKNISGTLYFNKQTGQMIRRLNGKEESMPNPILQVKRHAYLLKRWLESYNIRGVDIEYFVTISNPFTILQINDADSDIFERIVPPEALIEKINTLELQASKSVLSTSLHTLISKLQAKKIYISQDIYRKLDIQWEHIRKGVRCPHCSSFLMGRKQRNWWCTKCHQFSKDAHVEAILDYLLFHSMITNKQCRAFLQISSRHTVKRLLNNMKLPHNNKKIDRKYFYPQL